MQQLPQDCQHTWPKLLGYAVQFMFQLFFCLRGQETIDKISMKHIQLVESDDLEFSYFHLVNRLPDKNHKTDLESEGSGIESSLFILVLY